MAEEEAGFTFVDKRRTQAAAPAETLAGNRSRSRWPPRRSWRTADAATTPDEPDGGSEAGVAPTTYDLIGYCINLLSSQAWQKLGLLADPQTGEAKPDLAEAKVAIDAVGDLAARLETAPDRHSPPTCAATCGPCSTTCG